MSVSETIQATYKGVPFLVRVETEDGGRKVAVHEFPGSDDRFVQDLGLNPGVFRIEGYVTNTPGKDDWVYKSRRLTTVLKQDTEGVLEMSTFGIRKVKAQTFSKTLTQKELGITRFFITFLISTDNPSPVVSVASEQTVAVKASAVLDAAEEDVAKGLIVPSVATEALVSAYDGTEITNTVADRIARIGQNIDGVTSFANNVRNNIADFTRDPVAYASAMFNDGLLGAVFNTIETSRTALTALSDLTRTGYNLAQDFESIKENSLSNLAQSFDIPTFGDDVNYRLTNNNNRITITNSVRTAVLATYMKEAVNNDYVTDSDINDTINDINEAYENIVLIDGVDPLTALALDRCRIDALEVLNTKIQNTPNVVDKELNTPTTDIELAYRLYAEDFAGVEQLEESAAVLTDLNDILPNRFKGEVQVLQL